MYFSTLIQKVDFINTKSNLVANVHFFLTTHLLGCTTVEINGTPLILVKVERWLDTTTRGKLCCPPCFEEINSQCSLNKYVLPYLEDCLPIVNLFGVSFVHSIVWSSIRDRFLFHDML